MIRLCDFLVQKRRRLIVDRDDVMTVLEVIDEVNRNSKIHILLKMEVGNCGWADEPNKWFIHFDSTTIKWKTIIKELHKIDYKIILKFDNRFYLTKD